jgi:hypothetical protein
MDLMCMTPKATIAVPAISEPEGGAAPTQS